MSSQMHVLPCATQVEAAAAQIFLISRGYTAVQIRQISVTQSFKYDAGPYGLQGTTDSLGPCIVVIAER